MPCFWHMIKIKKIPGCPNMEYNVIFKHFQQNIRAYPRSKRKSALINDCENIAYWEDSEQSEALEGGFLFPALKLTQNYYINMNIFSSKLAI